MKRKLLVILLLVFVLSSLCACGVNFGSLEDNAILIPQKTGTLGAFALTSPTAGQTVYDIPTFTWEASTNASHYTFEMCSTLDFSNVDNMGNTIDTYIKKTGITDTQITPTATIRQKDQTYYWRVTAHNADGSKVCTGDNGTFYLGIPDVDKIEIPIDFADEWERHTVGSYADVSIDKSNFFGNNKNSLVITFAEEDTNRGNPESDGWMCFTHSVEKDFYGVDAFKFNFYYSGDDATVLIRVVDADNEYWQAKVQIAGNNKQNVIIRFDDFSLRTSGGTTIANQVFDYNYIRTVDFTFERTFGDGVAVISDLAAVKFADYEHLFIKKFDFSCYSQEDFVYNASENTTFTPEIQDDGATLSLKFSGNNGYGFARLPINAFLEKGDAFKMTLNYTGSSKDEANIVLRLLEEDGDRWSYTHKASLCGTDGVTIIVPFSAFALSEAAADGGRQFSYLQQLQFGFSGVYGSGTLTFSNLEVVTLAEEMDNLYQKEVGADGIVDNFEGYTSGVEMYYDWQSSDTNKDEAMSLSNIGTFSFDNTSYGVFAYKSDMSPASYGTNLTVPAGFTSLTFTAKDNSSKDDTFTHLDGAPAKLVVTLYNQTGKPYTYTVDAVASDWTIYNIPLSAFVGTTSATLTSENVSGIKFELQYFYYDEEGKAQPSYRPQNQVFMDDIAFASNDTLTVSPASTRITVGSDANLVVVDNFNGYEQQPTGIWSNGALTTSHNSTNALAVAFAEGSAQTTMLLQVDDAVQANALALALKGDGQTTVTVSITFVYAGKEYTVATTLYNVGDWTNYTIGWDHFKTTASSGGMSLNKNIVSNITAITISATTTNGETANLLVDDICLNNSVSGATKTQTAL